MSTELNFNSAEKTWDCPAHGGRFRTDGTLLEGPPKHSLKISSMETI
jgi:Rieske Fe-S protein